MLFGVITSSCVNMFAVKELNESAVQYIEKGEYENAIARLESSIDLDGNSYETAYNLAYTYLKVEKCDKALEYANMAEKLAKVEQPAVYYTKAVALGCLAKNIYHKTGENGEKETIEYKDEQTKLDMQQKYVDYLTQANENFEKYLKASPEASDSEAVKNEISANLEDIEKINSPAEVNE